MKQKVIGIVGFIGSGKGTVGDYLVKCHGWQSVSFASSLKDATAAIFGWPRNLLEGNTPNSRLWREQADHYWSSKMNFEVTPRWVLQQLGTNVLRNNFFDDIWVASLERKIMHTDSNVVITDVRFPNEINMIRSNGGRLWWVKRDPLPKWYQCAATDPESMPLLYPDVHASEYLWCNQGPFAAIDNNSTLEHLYHQVDLII
jgi:hypothetical protein